MSFTFDLDTKERVRAATDIVDLIGSRLELRRDGRNFKALCPWHADRRPSLQINVERQIWKCWVCDIGGDVFNFVMKDEGLTFPEALQKLADRAGIHLESKAAGGAAMRRADPGQKASLYNVMKWASGLFQSCFQDPQVGEPARRYMVERGLTQECLKQFEIGFAPDRWSYLLDRCQRDGYSPALLEAAGLISKRESGGHYDFFRNRVMFPIRDRDHRTIAFGGRVLPGTEQAGGKYINSRETPLFTKSQHLFGLDVAGTPIRHAKQAIVMEGYTDVMFSHQCGITNAVAVLGTALGAAHLKRLRHYCDQVVLLLDGDEAGQKRSDEVLELFLGAQMDVRILSLPDGMDPADYLKAHGGEQLRELLKSTVDALEFKMRRISTGFDPLLDTARATVAMENMLSLLAKVPHSGLLTHESFKMRQDQILNRMSRQFGVPEASLRDRLAGLRQRQEKVVRREPSGGPVAPQPKRLLRPGDLTPIERELLELVIVSPLVAPMALERVQPEWLQSDAAREMLNAYQELEFTGHPLDFDNVLNALEDPTLKSLLVTLHEQANQKLTFTRESAENRLRSLTLRMGEQQDVLRRQRQLNELQSGKLSVDDELALLNDVILQARLRQGLVGQDSAPSKSGSGVAEEGQP